MSFAVRPAILADAEAVTAVLAASYPVSMAGHYDVALLAVLMPLITVAQPHLLASGRYYVAEAGSDIVGCGGWSHERPGSGEVEPGLGHIRHFATHPDWAGRGVGRTLFERCLSDAAAEGVTAFECNSNLNAEGFYRALGFAPLREVQVPITPRHPMPALLMRRPAPQDD